MALTRDQVRERLKYAQLTLSNTMQSIFSSDVAERVKRNIVAIFIMTDATLRYVEVWKLIDGHATPAVDPTDYEIIFDNVPIDIATGPFGLVQLPNNYDIENPIIVLEGGTNLSFKASAGAPEVTVIYWDDEL